MNLYDHLLNLGITPTKASTADGGEYSSACPACGDDGKGRRSDRFRIWPEKENKGGLCKGRFWCRRCDAGGDAIEFMQRFYNMDFLAACEALGVDLPRRSKGSFSRYQSAPTSRKVAFTWEPTTYPMPQPLWQEKGGNLLADCQKRLADTPSALAYLAGRGLSASIVQKFGLGYNLSSKGKDRYRPRKIWGLADKPGKKKQVLWIPRGYLIPCFRDGELMQLRVRRLEADIKAFAPEIKYLPLEGSSMATMVLNPGADFFAVVECGFDAFLLADLFGDSLGVVTTWNSSARPDLYAHRLLTKAALVINLLDYDQGGEDQQEWWRETYPQNFRPQAPPVGADPGEMAEKGLDIRVWLLSVLPKGVRLRLAKEGEIAPPATAPTEKREPEALAPVVCHDAFEVDLDCGTTIFVTDSPDRWQELTEAGKKVASKNELARIGEAVAVLDDETRMESALAILDTKQIFGGYVRSSTPAEEVENCQHQEQK